MKLFIVKYSNLFAIEVFGLLLPNDEKPFNKWLTEKLRTKNAGLLTIFQQSDRAVYCQPFVIYDVRRCKCRMCKWIGREDDRLQYFLSFTMLCIKHNGTSRGVNLRTETTTYFIVSSQYRLFKLICYRQINNMLCGVHHSALKFFKLHTK